MEICDIGIHTADNRWHSTVLQRKISSVSRIGGIVRRATAAEQSPADVIPLLPFSLSSRWSWLGFVRRYASTESDNGAWQQPVSLQPVYLPSEQIPRASTTPYEYSKETVRGRATDLTPPPRNGDRRMSRSAITASGAMASTRQCRC